MDFSYYYGHLDLKAMAKPDFSTLFLDPVVFANLVKDLSSPFKGVEFNKVACPESMGFILGSAIAHKMKKGLVPIRKGGKLPTIKSHIVGHSFVDYTKEKNRFEMNKALVSEGDRVLLVDDWIETGGQARGLIKLLEKRGAEVVGISVLGFNRVKKTRSLSDNYTLNAIYDYTMEGERDLTKPLA